MLVVSPPIFVGDTKIIFRHYFVTPLSLAEIMGKQKELQEERQKLKKE